VEAEIENPALWSYNSGRSIVLSESNLPTINHHQMNINIQFNPDGTAICLWTEALPLHELGRLEITRASNIEFNNTTQHWEVIDSRGRMRFFARSRSACLEWEHQNLQA